MPYSNLSNAVISSEAHEEAMISLPVDVRDGDDHILLSDDSVEEEDKEEEGTVDRIDINTETGEVDEDSDEELESDEEAYNEEEIPESGDPKTFEEAGESVQEAIKGTEEIIQSAIERGLAAEMVDVLKAEYNSDGVLSDASYEALAAVGYTKGFVDSYIKGQEAVAERFINSIVTYAGGEDAYSKVQDTLSANESMADAFNAALDRNDVITMKALIDSAKESHRQAYGKRPSINLTKAAKAPAAPAATESVKPFESRAEMIAAMSSKEYRNSVDFRQSVEQRLLVSRF